MSTAGATEGARARRRILVVDDEDDIRELARISLERLGNYRVVTGRTGAEALEKAESEPPDAVLLDVMMPDMDGPATFRELRARPATRHVPVILLTAKVQPVDRRRFAELGVDGLIAKPFDPMTLAARVAETLGWE